MNNIDRCEWGARKGQKMLRCTAKAKTTVYVNGGPVNLCPSHTAVVQRMERLTTEHERRLEELHNEEIRISEVAEELRRRDNAA